MSLSILNPPANRDVFINCPFDAEYEELFQAICFTLAACGFNPRCALEELDSGETRIEKIRRIVAHSAFGIHDLSRTGLSGLSQLPRFNMPFELGLFLGCKFYGGSKHKKKRTLILDTEPYRYQQFLSDIAGQDPHAHHGDPAQAIKAVRDWLAGSAAEALPGPIYLHQRFTGFRHDLPLIAEHLGAVHTHLSFQDLIHILRRWLHWQRQSEPSPVP
ncbi:MAG: hypothetical protein JNK48_11875 [Bryobacterales bacterium]|nr:hypothetical protein [Bryobacterales bacterium]